MPLVLTSGPASEPVTLAEAKAHLRVDHTSEDALIASLILTSRLHIEAALGLALITQSWRLELDAWPHNSIVEVPLRPLQSVTAVRVRTQTGTTILVPADDYIFDTAAAPPRVAPVNGGWPTAGRRIAGIELDLLAGFGPGAADVPAPIRQALLMLVAHWYEHRDPVEVGQPATRVPLAVSQLLMPYRMVRV
jgi:uncharacterized phiE125 gp8 family phage protein